MIIMIFMIILLLYFISFSNVYLGNIGRGLRNGGLWTDHWSQGGFVGLFRLTSDIIPDTGNHNFTPQSVLKTVDIQTDIQFDIQLTFLREFRTACLQMCIKLYFYYYRRDSDARFLPLLRSISPKQKKPNHNKITFFLFFDENDTFVLPRRE